MPAPTLNIETYRKLFRKCIQTRTPVDKFESYFNQLLARSPIPPQAICDTILEPTLTTNAPDPLHLQYVARLVERDLVCLANVLGALLKSSAAKASTSPSDSFHDLSGREPLEQDVFLVLAGILRTHKPRSSDSVWTAVEAMSDWMEALMAVSGAGMLGEGGAEGLAEAAMVAEPSAKLRIEALAEMVIALGANEQAAKILGEAGRKEKKLTFRSSLSLFTQYVQVQNPPLASRLEELGRLYQSPSPRQQKGGDAIDGMMLGLEEGADLGPVVWTRAHLFVWLDSLLCGRPHVDDETILGYLYNRYKDDANTMVMDFITAVIDVISNALVRGEPPSTLFLLRSFLCNKVPLIINRISPSPMMSSYAISQSFLRTDVTALMNLPTPQFDPLRNSSNSGTDALFGDITIDLRQDFLFACALHGVIGEQDIQGILGELPLGAMPSGRYNYREIQGQCAADPRRVDQLLEEIEGVEGNSGAVVRALYEIMKGMCVSRETMPLRNICSFLVRKPSSIDVMLLFFKPAEILEPLCDLLDTWRYEEDQGEYQPVYEEFGYILLLVLTMVQRYSLTVSDLACTHSPNNSGFVPQLLHQYSTAQRLENLSSDRHAQLGGWIKELYEDEGISDGLMASCLPQEFYRLVPTLFSQSLLAVKYGVLDLDSVKGASSFLLAPFLLPSVISGLVWLTHHLWSNLDTNPAPTLSVIASLIATPENTETAETHRTVVAIVARPLDAVLRELLRRQNLSPDTAHMVQQLHQQLRHYHGFHRNAISSREEVESWAHAVGHGGLAIALANAYNSLLMWSGGGGQYTTRLLVASWKLLGARKVVEIILQEAAKMKSGAADDVAAAMLGAYVGSEEGRVSLREALSEVGGEVARKVEIAWRPWVGQGVGGVGAGEDVDLAAMQGMDGIEGMEGMDLMIGGGEFGGMGGMGILEGMEM
ncbi:mediator complex, subunit Med5 [Sphaerosporella brunnea]|uniref:Mediator of RNA polymerase II transcription subunit 5 n=1 Tax=Sphaerosporella brunnea TaxID=1250544 RepID=A0A5J5EGD5_9PEZI|nr:mediator complex, subunit Med5 [Sphaerosporella brunnea]